MNKRTTIITESPPEPVIEEKPIAIRGYVYRMPPKKKKSKKSKQNPVQKKKLRTQLESLISVSPSLPSDL